MCYFSLDDIGNMCSLHVHSFFIVFWHTCFLVAMILLDAFKQSVNYCKQPSIESVTFFNLAEWRLVLATNTVPNWVY